MTKLFALNCIIDVFNKLTLTTDVLYIYWHQWITGHPDFLTKRGGSEKEEEERILLLVRLNEDKQLVI